MPIAVGGNVAVSMKIHVGARDGERSKENEVGKMRERPRGLRREEAKMLGERWPHGWRTFVNTIQKKRKARVKGQRQHEVPGGLPGSKRR